MAIIYSYPSKANPKLTDLLLITDKEAQNPINQTKTITIQQIADLVDDEVTLQEVLNASNPGVTPPTAGATGNIILTGNIATTNLTATSDATVGNNAAIGNNLIVDGDLTMNTATSDIIMSKGNIQTQTASDLNFVVTNGGQVYNFDPSSTDIDFNVGITSNRIRNANWELDGDFDLNAFGNVVFDSNTQTIRSGGDAIFASTGADTVIGANDTLYLGRTTGTYEPVNTVIHAEQTIDISTDTGFTRFMLNGQNAVPGPQLESKAPHWFEKEIRLNGKSPGTTGQIMISKGAGVNPEWVNASTLSVENLIEEVENNTAVLIPKGTPIYIAGNVGGIPRVAPADASVPGQMPASGLAFADIPNVVGSAGQMIIAGQLDNVNTAAFAVGDTVYVDSGGGLAGKPNGATEGIQNVGIVTESDAATGSIQVTAVGRINDLPNNNPNALFTADANGHPVSTINTLEVIPGVSTVIGNSGTYVPSIGLYSSDFTCNVYNSTNAGPENLQIGYGALQQAMQGGGTAASNIAIGVRAMQGNPAAGAAFANYNVAIGNDSLSSTVNLANTVTGNVAIGHQSMQGGAVNAFTNYNTSVGYQSLFNLTGIALGTADNNTAVGASALFNVTHGGENTAVGVSAGQSIISGSYNTFVGHNSGTTNNTIMNATAIGQNADVQVDSGTSLGQDTVVQGIGSVALGKGAFNTAPNTVTINVSGINGPSAWGGLQPAPPGAGTLPPGLTPGDLYYLPPGIGGNVTSHNLIAIVP